MQFNLNKKAGENRIFFYMYNLKYLILTESKE